MIGVSDNRFGIRPIDHQRQIPGGVSLRTLITGTDTGGSFALLEICVPRGGEPPLHLHTREDEYVYVLEGNVTFCVGGERIACTAGACLLLPRGEEHTFIVTSQQVRLLIVLKPAGLEDFYRELSRPSELTSGEAGLAFDGVERLITIAAHYGVEITGSRP